MVGDTVYERRIRRLRGILQACPCGQAGISTFASGLSSPTAANAAVFGFAVGIFLHVAMDFLPRCETGDEIDELVRSGTTKDSRALPGRIRFHTVASTALGGLIVFAAWVVLAL